MKTDNAQDESTSDSSALLYVFREVDNQQECIGSLSGTRDAASFTYSPQYLASSDAVSISLSLPLQKEPFSSTNAPNFFEGLLPEGPLREAFAYAIHTDADAVTDILAKLNNESIGGLLFSTQANFPINNRQYKQLEFSSLSEFAHNPNHSAIIMSSISRLSLSGAQTKVGLYHQEGEKIAQGWYLPEGSAPSNTILKAASSHFPQQILNEAFCLCVAKHCNFDTASYSLLPISKEILLLSVSRFDRMTSKDATLVSSLPLPIRLHQEDFCQAAGLSSLHKYEPTDGNFLELGAGIIRRSSSNPFGDVMMFLSRILFDFIIGNCDNHLKNHAMLWSQDWSSRELAPLYDITCTTMYPTLDREMGISLCPSRRIDDVTSSDIKKAFRRIGISSSLGWQTYTSLCEEFHCALTLAEQEITNLGFPEVKSIARFIEKDSSARCLLH